jgi:predicted nuclease of predicted toxin-antitoxin system
MKFLLDQGLPRSTVQHLSAAGVTSDHVGDLGLAAATDETILAEARTRDAVVVTLDSDFHALLALSGATTPSVIRIRMQGLRGDGVANIILQVIATAQSELEAGAAVTVTNRRLALRKLPLIQLSNDDAGS